MKRIYFVRHGETVANIEARVQGLDDPLTPEGEMQAVRVAERVASLPIERCIASDALRTRQTAQSIEDSLKMPFTFTPLFREIRRPTSLTGVLRETDAYKKFLRDEMSRLGEDWHVEDEENFPDRLSRAQEALAFLEEQPENDILVVTHGHFLRLLVSTLLLQGRLTPELWLRMGSSFWTSNTGITVCTWDDTRWRLMTWNDHAHFGDDVFRPLDQ